jgi:hypothetical protein
MKQEIIKVYEEKKVIIVLFIQLGLFLAILGDT